MPNHLWSSLTGLIAGAAVLGPCFAAPSFAYSILQRQNQAEARDASGRVTVEQSVINVVACNGAGENGGQFYIYQYVKRPGFRAISPPNWGAPIGGRDFGSFEEAAGAACGGGAPTGGGSIRVTQATYGGNCRAPAGNMTQRLAQACDGKPRCDYKIDYTVIGDPASGCAKNFIAQWSCGGAARNASAPPEAGFGSVITLACP